MTQKSRVTPEQIAANEAKMLADFPDETTWLLNYQGNFHFYLSLRSQMRNEGYLSEKQIASVRRAMEKQGPQQDLPLKRDAGKTGFVVPVPVLVDEIRVPAVAAVVIKKTHEQIMRTAFE